jgi:hypothetical protein
LACVVAAAALVPVGRAGTKQANHLYHEWANSTQVINVLRPLVADAGGRPVLMDDAEIARYYLENELSLPYWVDTFYYSYHPPGSSVRLTGNAAYAAAVDDGAFSVIALDFGEQIHVDRAIAAAIHDSRRYAWVGDYSGKDTFGTDTYVVWRLKAPSSRDAQ